MEIPSNHIGIVELKEGRKKGVLTFACGKVDSPPGMKARIVNSFDEMTTFILPTTYRGNGDSVIAVYYRIARVGAHKFHIFDQENWLMKQQEFLKRFPERLDRYWKYGRRKSASIFNLEENGELTKLAYQTAGECSWRPIQIFGAGMSKEMKRDPFDLTQTPK